MMVQYSIMNDDTFKANEEQKLLNKKYAEINKTRKQKRLEKKLAKL